MHGAPPTFGFQVPTPDENNHFLVDLFAPNHTSMPFLTITREMYSLKMFQALSKHITCPSCMHLTCCGKYASWYRFEDWNYRAFHELNCPFYTMCLRLTEDELTMLYVDAYLNKKKRC